MNCKLILLVTALNCLLSGSGAFREEREEVGRPNASVVYMTENVTETVTVLALGARQKAIVYKVDNGNGIIFEHTVEEMAATKTLLVAQHPGMDCPTLTINMDMGPTAKAVQPPSKGKYPSVQDNIKLAVLDMINQGSH